jgi:hypothetical protein
MWVAFCVSVRIAITLRCHSFRSGFMRGSGVGPQDRTAEQPGSAEKHAEYHLLRFGLIITCHLEVLHEKAFGCATRSRDSLHRPVIGGYACVCVRRLRSEPPSQSVGPLRLGRSKSSLVPETHGPCSRSWSQWDAVVYEVRRPRPLRALHHLRDADPKAIGDLLRLWWLGCRSAVQTLIEACSMNRGLLNERLSIARHRGARL